MTVQNGDMLRCDMIGDHQDVDEVVASFQFQMLTGGPISDALAVADLIELLEDLWVVAESLYNIYVYFRRIRVQDVVSARLLPVGTFSPALVGTNPGDAAPAQATFPMTFKTTVPRVMLRKMFGPTSEGAFNIDGQMTGAVESYMDLVAAFLLLDYPATSAAWQYGYYSPKTLGWVSPDSAQYTKVPGSLRKRRQGSGS